MTTNTETASNLWTNCIEGGKQTFAKKKTRVGQTDLNKDYIDPESKRKLVTQSESIPRKRLKTNNDETSKNEPEHSQSSSIPHPSIVSSLFHKNPEIPLIEGKPVKQIIERMFSSQTLKEYNIHPYIVSNLVQQFNIECMTAVQEKTIPRILNGEDVLVKSQTGSGKTLAYVVPIVHQLQAMEPKIDRTSGLFVCVILPTRELALQTFECFQKMLRAFTRIVPSCFMGGQRKKSEKASLRRGVNVIVTTPQRLIDHLKNSRQFSFSKLKYLVIDEADRLMEMGYEQNVAEIMTEISKQREGNIDPLITILLSATLTQGVQKLAGLSMRKPVTIDISSESDQWGASHLLVTPSNLQHHLIVVPAKLRLVCLATFILWKCRGDQHKILVFMPTQDAVDYFTKLMSHITSFRNEEGADTSPREIQISRLHGNMSQQMRNEVFKNIRNANCGVLFCTDVCARGLDLPKVDWILQYSAPSSVAEYVHRVGRTARIGTRGDALLFLLPSEVDYVGLLEQNRIKLHQMSLDEVLEALPRVAHVESRKAKLKKTMETIEEAATSLQLECERYVEKDDGVHDLAKKAFLSLARSYATYPVNQRSIFNMKNLHLGHLAKGLALRDTPTELGVGSRMFQNQRSYSSSQDPRQQKRFNQRAPSSSSSGRFGGMNMKAMRLAEYQSGT